jgi:hypothetical protein
MTDTDAEFDSEPSYPTLQDIPALAINGCSITDKSTSKFELESLSAESPSPIPQRGTLVKHAALFSHVFLLGREVVNSVDMATQTRVLETKWIFLGGRHRTAFRQSLSGKAGGLYKCNSVMDPEVSGPFTLTWTIFDSRLQYSMLSCVRPFKSYHQGVTVG